MSDITLQDWRLLGHKSWPIQDSFIYLLWILLFSNSKVMFSHSIRVPPQTYTLALFETKAQVHTWWVLIKESHLHFPLQSALKKFLNTYFKWKDCHSQDFYLPWDLSSVISCMSHFHFNWLGQNLIYTLYMCNVL